MGFHDGRHDGQTQTAAAHGSATSAISSVEAFEHAVQIGLGNARTLIVDFYPDAVLTQQTNLHGHRLDSVDHGIAGDGGKHLCESGLVALHNGRFRERQLYRACWLHHRHVGRQSPKDLDEVHGVTFHGSPLINGGQQQQIVHQHRHSVGLTENATHGIVELRLIGESACLIQRCVSP